MSSQGAGAERCCCAVGRVRGDKVCLVGMAVPVGSAVHLHPEWRCQHGACGAQLEFCSAEGARARWVGPMVSDAVQDRGAGDNAAWLHHARRSGIPSPAPTRGWGPAPTGLSPSSGALALLTASPALAGCSFGNAPPEDSPACWGGPQGSCLCPSPAHVEQTEGHRSRCGVLGRRLGCPCVLLAAGLCLWPVCSQEGPSGHPLELPPLGSEGVSHAS